MHAGAATSAPGYLHDVSFDLRTGEVLGLTGLVGSGYEDFVYALFGGHPTAADGSLVVRRRARDLGQR